MPSKHEVQPGDTLLKLAFEAGFDSWKRIWDLAENAELRELRKDPQVLLPGDVLKVPEREATPQTSCPVDKEHRFRLVRPRAWVNLRMIDDEGEPLSQRRYRFQCGGRTHEGTTDDDGVLSVEIQPNVHHGHIWFWSDEDLPPFESAVMVGYLDPASTWSGISGRLSNLGAHDLVSSATLPTSERHSPAHPIAKALREIHGSLAAQHDERAP